MLNFKKFLKFSSADTVERESQFFHDGKYEISEKQNLEAGLDETLFSNQAPISLLHRKLL